MSMPAVLLKKKTFVKMKFQIEKQTANPI